MAATAFKPHTSVPQPDMSRVLPWAVGQPLVVFVLRADAAEDDGSDDWFLIGPVAPIGWQVYPDQRGVGLAIPIWPNNEDVETTGIVLPDGRVVESFGVFHASVEDFKVAACQRAADRHKAWKDEKAQDAP